MLDVDLVYRSGFSPTHILFFVGLKPNLLTIEDCISRIIELGLDSDTNGAVSGSLSGLYNGLRGNLAQDYWVNKIIKKDMINTVIEKYIKILNV